MTCSTNTYWLEQSEADVPPGDQWLTDRERSRLARFRFEKRRTEWRIGRWTAKRAVASYLNLPFDRECLQDVEILALQSGAPEVFLFKQTAKVSISISHRGGYGFCVVGSSRASLGCDLEVVEPRDHSFVTDFFTSNEQHLVDTAPAQAGPMLATLVWSAKESALKAMHVGLRFDTASLEVNFFPGTPETREGSRHDLRVSWFPLSIHHKSGLNLSGWWRCADNVVRTVVFNTLPTGLEC